MQSTPLERLRAGLAATDRIVPDEKALEQQYPDARRGAVLALFYPRQGESHVVLTRRTPHLSVHSGQISLPGGRIDPLDFSPLEAALRETREELGIATAEVEVVGPLAPVFIGASGYLLLPYVGFDSITPAFVPNPAEVAEVIELPMRHLLQESTVQEELWLVRERLSRVGFYRYREHKIWGATARVLRQIVELAGGPPPPAHLVPPGDVAGAINSGPGALT